MSLPMLSRLYYAHLLKNNSCAVDAVNIAILKVMQKKMSRANC